MFNEIQIPVNVQCVIVLSELILISNKKCKQQKKCRAIVMAEDGESDKPSSEDTKSSAPAVKAAPANGSLDGPKSVNGVDLKMSEMSKKETSVNVVDVLKSTQLDDAAKFDVFRGLVECGKLTNKEVVNSILHLVRH